MRPRSGKVIFGSGKITFGYGKDTVLGTFGARFGALIKVKRGFEGLTQQQLALMAFGDESFKTRISELENGKVSNPQQKTVDSLVVALDIAQDELAECRKLSSIDDNDLQLENPIAVDVPIDAAKRIGSPFRPRWLGFGALGLVALVIGIVAVGTQRRNAEMDASPGVAPSADLATNGGKPELAKAVRLYRKGCEEGTAHECNQLGRLYLKGQGVAQSSEEAARLHRLACNGGNAAGCTDLGLQYENGNGVSKNLVEAARLHRLACDSEYARGCNNLGVRYERGKGVVGNVTEAVRLYRLACEGKNARGCSNLGGLYRHGKEVTRDLVEAMRLYSLACDLGEGQGCNNLGVGYDRGEGVAKNPDEAKRLFRLACERNDAKGCENLGKK